MPYVFSEEPNELLIQDHISGQEIALQYRLPTTQERVGYASESVQRKGKKVEFRGPAVRQKYGLAILTGIRKGDFAKRLPDGGLKPVSSDPGDPDHDPQWKALVGRHASHLVDLLATRVFEAAASVMAAEDASEEAEGDAVAGEGEESLGES